jgi:MHS family proline/betaine transporter-like MFS transporter
MRLVSRSIFSSWQLWNACLGNLFEHYDTALFGFLSPFLASLIFPDQDPLTALVLTYALIPLGMIARPFGALVFGHIGDVYGRRYALSLTLGGMAVASGCIAFSPTYAQAGILAPILFCLGMVAQNFFSAGETMGGAIFILENSPEKRHDLLSSLYSSSAIGGHLLASLGIFLLSHYQVIDSGWRFLYLFGCITALFGGMIRRQCRAVPPSLKSAQTFSKLTQMFWEYKQPFLLIVVCSGFAHATYSMALVLMNGFIPLVSSLTKAEVMKINTYLLLLDFCALPLFGWIASKVIREKLMLSVSVGVVLFSMPLIISLQGASLAQIIGVRIIFVIFGVAFFAPFHAWAQQLIPPTCRYAVISFGYALGSQLLGSPTAALALWCFQKTGMISSIAWYWMALGLTSSISIVMALQTTGKSQLHAQL